MSSSANPWILLGAAVVGIVSAATMYIAEHYRQERRRQTLSQNLAHMNQQMSALRKELEQLRSLQKTKNASRKKKRGTNTPSVFSTTTTDDYSSAVDIDSSDMEFYDLSDEEASLSNSGPPAALDEVDAKLDSGDLKEVSRTLEQLAEMCLENPGDPELLWRIGRAHHKIADATEDRETKEENVRKGVVACEVALSLNPDSVGAHKWMAVLIGCRSELVPLKERIKDGYLFKEHVDAAIALTPEDASLHHMLGRFAYEVASLKWYERKAAATFFAEPPSATYEDALRHFSEAEKLIDHEWKENKLLLAKTLIALRDYSGAVQWLEKASKIQTKELNDKVDTEVNSLLEKYNSYR